MPLKINNTHSRESMTTSEYAEKIVELIHERPRGVNAGKLLYEVYVKFKVAEGLRAVKVYCVM